MIGTGVAGILIDGREMPAKNAETFETFDPSTGEKIADVARGTEADIDAAVSSARNSFDSEWSMTTPRERSSILNSVAALVRERADDLDGLGSRNGGLPLSAVRNDIEVAARYFEYYAGLVDKVSGETVPLGPGYVDYTVREPWGVCGVIVPFNSPYQLAARSIAPALAAANTVVVKASEQAPLSTLRLGQLLLDAGLPAGVVNVVPGFGNDAGAHLAAHPGVDHLTFTGSPATAQRVLEAAATELTPTTVELGGKSPQIVFADADLDEAARTIMSTLVWSCGQACSAGTRILVEKPIHTELADALADLAGRVRVGRAIDSPDMGPLITRRQHEAVLEGIRAAAATNARLLVGGGVPNGEATAGGFFVEPTVFDEVDPGSQLAQEEIFGPVLAITEFETADQALAYGNWSDFGLMAGVWTKDIDRALRLASGLRVGQVYVNNYGVGGGVELPFGGYKKSGFGREKGIAGFLEYTQLKNVCIKVGHS